jgi:energy-coupling factor transporter ATP-binding protein EcfA2
MLRHHSRQKLELMIDFEHPQAAVGSDLPAYVRTIDECDAVIVCLSPAYAERVARRDGSVAYAEYTAIQQRLEREKRHRTYGSRFLLLPVVFTHSMDRSAPPELQQALVVGDISWLNVLEKKNGLIVSREHRLKLRRFCEKLTDRLEAIALTKRPTYGERQEALFREFLFHDTKSRWDKPDNYRYLDSAFVKTEAFLKARNKQVAFIIGRKGAGKSTITHVLPILSKPKPQVVLRLDFEELPLHMCFNILMQKPRAASDLRNAFTPLDSYQLAWDGFLHLYYAWQMRRTFGRRSPVGRILHLVFSGLMLRAADDAEENAIATRALFVYTFERLLSYIDEFLLRDVSAPLASAAAALTPSAFRNFLFTRTGWAAVRRHIEKAGSLRSILITADGFDVMVQHFRDVLRDEAAAASAAEFERDLLLALFQIVLNRGPMRLAGGPLYQRADYCVAVPHDRFIEVRAKDRDRYKYRHRVAHISWSGIELSALVRKRLSLLRKVEDPKEGLLSIRLKRVMESGFPELPESIEFNFASAPYRMPLFLYVLRHTFWRPRDVLFYYASLLSAAEMAQRKGGPLTSEAVRQVIANATRTVVRDEFIGEFVGIFPNLDHVLRRFASGPQVMSWAELKNRIEDIRFDTTLPVDRKASLEWKFETLYEIGAMGLVLTRESSRKLGVHRHAFIFNEGMLVGDKIRPERYEEYEFALHPVLCEEYQLDTSANSELILPLDWGYLDEKEIMRGSQVM